MICENIKCGKEHDGSFGSGRFCSKKCAATFSGKFNLHTNLKKATCPKCGESHLIKLNAVAKSTLCDSCKKIRSKKIGPKKIKHCKICGQIICPRVDK